MVSASRTVAPGAGAAHARQLETLARMQHYGSRFIHMEPRNLLPRGPAPKRIDPIIVQRHPVDRRTISTTAPVSPTLPPTRWPPSSPTTKRRHGPRNCAATSREDGHLRIGPEER